MRGRYSRQARMSVTRMPRAPSSHSSSMIRLVSLALDHRAHGDPALVVQRADGRRLDAGGDRAGVVDLLDADVVVDHDVPAGDDDAVEAADQLVDLGVGSVSARRTSTASDSRIGSPTISRPAWRSVVPVDTTSAITSATPRRTAVSTAPSRGITSARSRAGEVALHQPRVRGGDPLAREVVDVVGGSRHRRVAEGRTTEAEREDLLGSAGRVEQQVAAGDPDVELAGADVGGDVARAQEEELGVVLRVDEHELALVVPLAVAGLASICSGPGEGALVRHGDAISIVGVLGGPGRGSGRGFGRVGADDPWCARPGLRAGDGYR
jgi:hypothetical protein